MYTDVDLRIKIKKIKVKPWYAENHAQFELKSKSEYGTNLVKI